MISKPEKNNCLNGLSADVIGSFLVVLIFTGIVEYRTAHPELSQILPRDSKSLLGAEYDSIARAIRHGRGFSDPFEEESGATAWMTPVLPYLLAGLYWLFNDERNQVVDVIEVLQMFSNVLTCFFVLRVARSLREMHIGYVSIVIVFLINLLWLFQRTHDVWLLLVLYNFIWLGALRGWSIPASLSTALAWGAFGGFVALCSPVAGFTWAVATCVTNARHLASARHRIHFGIVALASIVVVCPWTFRNRVVLDKWVPIKSNFAYEVWQAQCVDDDGVLDSSTFSQHPWPSDGPERQRYIDVGEVEFVSSRWPLFGVAVAQAPMSYLQRVLNRFTAATWYYETTFQSHENLWITPLQRSLFWIPFACLLLTAGIKNASLIETKGGDLAVLICLCGLVIYVLFSYYQRYSAPLAGIQMLLIVYGFGKLKRTLWRSTEKSRES